MSAHANESSPRHIHESDHLFVYLTRSELTTLQEGSEPETTVQDPGFTRQTRASGV